MKLQGKITNIIIKEGVNQSNYTPYYGGMATVVCPQVDGEPQQSFDVYIGGDPNGKMLPPGYEVGAIVEVDVYVQKKEVRGQNGYFYKNDVQIRNPKVVTPAAAQPF